MGGRHLPRALVHRSDLIGWVFNKTFSTHNIIIVEKVALQTEEISQYGNEMYFCIARAKYEFK